MVEKSFELICTSHSQKKMKAIYNYILADSPQNAKKVINDIRIRAAKNDSQS